MTQKKKKSVPSKHIHKGKGVTEPSKEAKLMDVVDQVLENIDQKEPYFRMKHLNRSKNDQNSQKFLICHLLLEEGIFSMYCCPLSSVQLVEDVQKLDFPLVSEPRPETKGHKVPGEILALKSGSWRVIDEDPGLIRNVVSGMHSLAFVHGAFHWVGISGNSLKYSMVSFNISRDVYGEIPLPEQICMIRDVINIGISVLDGMICAYSNMDHQGNDTFRLWVMKDYGLTESWNEVFTIADPYISMATPKYKFADGEVLFWCLQRGDSVFRTQRERSKLWPRGVFQNGFAFTESLISPKLLT
ncbi:F-box/kelch-repeat protein At3g06240-like [Lycium ferocissimum]|uniref:F-box/kelch-repeat protein At3g06240-like n=1 Tax=Lycium ferocissimum TaxID=112874 RepID=UPI002814E91C|nr:F-box/kelch-repeat protein At3g06240-like [Lycium ferocissimum]